MRIESILPIKVSVGDTVTIRGSGFGNSPGAVGFMFQMPTKIVSWSDTQIVCIVPEGAVTGSVVVRADVPQYAFAGIVTIANGPNLPPPPTPGDQILAELQQINDLRKSHGLNALTFNEQLSRSAQKYAASLEAGAPFDHFNNGTTPASRAAAEGYPSQFVGENIARGFFDVDRVMDAWEHSPGHLQNLLLPAYTEVGLGISGSSWVEDFGARMSGVSARDVISHVE